MIFTSRELRNRAPHDYYPTEGWVPRVAYLPQFVGIQPHRILDPGAGDGVWGKAARQCWPGAEITGVEVRELPQPTEYDRWLVGDFRDMELAASFDLIVGNPPYGDYDPESGRKIADLAEPFIRRSLELLRDGGILCFMLRLAFLESRRRYLGLWREYPPHHVVILADRPSFTGDGKTDSTAYALFYWVAGWQGQPTLYWAGQDLVSAGGERREGAGCGDDYLAGK